MTLPAAGQDFRRLMMPAYQSRAAVWVRPDCGETAVTRQSVVL